MRHLEHAEGGSSTMNGEGSGHKGSFTENSHNSSLAAQTTQCKKEAQNCQFNTLYDDPVVTIKPRGEAHFCKFFNEPGNPGEMRKE